MARRADILVAIYEAERLHKEFDSRSRAEGGEGRVDVFAMLVRRDIPVMVRPLKNLLGAFIDEPDLGVILTSQRPLPVQRFTAAHELGHAVLGHEASYDEEEVLTRALFVAGENFDPREMQANAFATQLLTPSWLIVHHMQRQGWAARDLADPLIVYQLSLRMGSSYAATCHAIGGLKAINRSTRDALLSVTPKSIKQKLLGGYQPDSYRGDVWLVTARDNGMVLDGSRADLVVINLPEHASAGYLWNFGDLIDAGLTIKEDGRQAFASEAHIGGLVFRTVIAEADADEGASGHVRLREVQPWRPTEQPLTSLDVAFELSGPVPEGLLPAQRQALLEVA